jgi:hypothetical protein
MEGTDHHPFDVYREQWRLVRREAGAGSKASAVISLAMLLAMLEDNATTCNPPGLPAWLLDDIREIFMHAIEGGAGLDEGFHLKQKRGRNLMANAARDMDVAALYSVFKSYDALADKADEIGLPPPKKGEAWTPDSLARAVAAHRRRIKSGLLFHSKTD